MPPSQDTEPQGTNKEEELRKAGAYFGISQSDIRLLACITITLEQAVEYAQKKYQEGELKGRIDEVKSLGGQTAHKADTGGWCRKAGEQFKECLQCLKDRRLSQLEKEEQ